MYNTSRMIYTSLIVTGSPEAVAKWASGLHPWRPTGDRLINTIAYAAIRVNHRERVLMTHTPLYSHLGLFRSTLQTHHARIGA